MPGSIGEWIKLSQSLGTLFAGIEEQVRDGIRLILETARDRVGSVESSLLAPTADGENLRFLVSVNPELEGSDILVPLGKSIAGLAFSAGQLVAAADVAEELGDRHFAEVDRRTKSRTKVYMVVPVTLGERMIGVLTFYNRPPDRENEPFPTEAIDLAQEFAARCASLLRFHQSLVEDMELARRGFAGTKDSRSTPQAREQWIEILERLETFPESDREFMADLLDLFEKRREQNLYNNLGLGASENE